MGLHGTIRPFRWEISWENGHPAFLDGIFHEKKLHFNPAEWGLQQENFSFPQVNSTKLSFSLENFTLDRLNRDLSGETFIPPF